MGFFSVKMRKGRWRSIAGEKLVFLSLNQNIGLIMGGCVRGERKNKTLLRTHSSYHIQTNPTEIQNYVLDLCLIF